MKLVAPFCMARTALSTVPYAVIMMTACCGLRSRISASISRPLRSGNAKSRSTRSNECSPSLARPCSPVSAETTLYPSISSWVSRDSRIPASSSIMRMEPAVVVPSTGGRLKTATSDIYSLSYHWKFKMKRGATARIAFHGNFSGMFLNDAVGHGKTQPGTARLAGARRALGGKERVINPLDVLRRDSRAGISHAYTHAGTVGGLYVQRAAGPGHSVPGIEKEVEKDLLEFARISMNEGQIVVQVSLHFYAGSLELVFQQSKRFSDDFVQADV